MSRKREPSRRARRPEDAVPDEILAEGSGPNEVIDANAQTLVEAAEGLVEKRKGRRAAKARMKAGDAARDAAADGDPQAGEQAGAADDTAEPTDASSEPADDLQAAAEADETAEAAGSNSATPERTSRGRKGRKKRKADAEVAEAAEPEDEADASASDTGADEEVAADAGGEGEGADAESGIAFDAAAEMVPPGDDASPEGETVAAVEDAVMRAEAEAELGDAETAEAADDEELGAALPTTAASMDAAQLKSLVEALVFAADKPVTVQRLRQLTRVSDIKRLEQALADITADFTGRGIVLQQVSGGYQFRTNTQYSVWVQQLIAGRPVRLSRAQLETLAIVAYRQPITRPEIDEIRGVDSSATLRLLLDRSLIRTLGKKEDVGRPMLYGTTKEFLDFFSLSDLRELPTLREYSELTAESRKVMSDRLGTDLDDEAGGEGVAQDDTAQDATAQDATAQDATAHVVAGTTDVSDPAASGFDAWGQPIAPDEDVSIADSDEGASAADVSVVGDGAEGVAAEAEDVSVAADGAEGVAAEADDESVAGEGVESPAADAEDVSVSGEDASVQVAADVDAEADDAAASDAGNDAAPAMTAEGAEAPDTAAAGEASGIDDDDSAGAEPSSFENDPDAVEARGTVNVDPWGQPVAAAEDDDVDDTAGDVAAASDDAESGAAHFTVESPVGGDEVEAMLDSGEVEAMSDSGEVEAASDSDADGIDTPGADAFDQGYPRGADARAVVGEEPDSDDFEAPGEAVDEHAVAGETDALGDPMIDPAIDAPEPLDAADEPPAE